jgi:hypothetical protein
MDIIPDPSSLHWARCWGMYARNRANLTLWDNHDEDWEEEKSISKHLQPIHGGPALRLRTTEGLYTRIEEGDEDPGALFLMHGHQATRKSDRWSRLSSLAVRYLYQLFQRLTGLSLDTPSRNHRLREAHDETTNA